MEVNSDDKKTLEDSIDVDIHVWGLQSPDDSIELRKTEEGKKEVSSPSQFAAKIERRIRKSSSTEKCIKRMCMTLKLRIRFSFYKVED